MKTIALSLLTLAMALFAAGGVVWAAGENPWNVYKILLAASFGSASAIGYTIFYATPLIFTGLSVALAFHAGLFNVGCEGQLYLGAFAAAWVGLHAPAQGGSSWLWVLLAVAASFFAGAAWGAIAGALKAWRGSHEVIVTIMLNAIATAVVSYLTLYVYRNPESQAIETLPISEVATIPSLSKVLPLPESSPANAAFWIALAAAGLFYVILWSTRAGFSLRAVGSSEPAARCAGIRVKQVVFWTMVVAGGLAGLVGANDILGNLHKFKDGFSPGYGFLGIAVALLGRNHPVGIILAALLFGGLQNGSIALDLDTEHLSRDLISILQGIIILAAACERFFRKRFS